MILKLSSKNRFISIRPDQVAISGLQRVVGIAASMPDVTPLSLDIGDKNLS